MHCEGRNSGNALPRSPGFRAYQGQCGDTGRLYRFYARTVPPSGAAASVLPESSGNYYNGSGRKSVQGKRSFPSLPYEQAHGVQAYGFGRTDGGWKGRGYPSFAISGLPVQKQPGASVH